MVPFAAGTSGKPTMSNWYDDAAQYEAAEQISSCPCLIIPDR